MIGGPILARILEVLTRKTCQFDEILAKKENFAISLRNDQKFMYKNAIKLGILVKFDRGALNWLGFWRFWLEKLAHLTKFLLKKNFFAILLRNDPKFMYKNAIKLGILAKFDRGAWISSDFGGSDLKIWPIWRNSC